MSENDEQIDKKIIWQSHIQNSKDRLIELEKVSIRINNNQNRLKKDIIRELAQSLENDGMATGLYGNTLYVDCLTSFDGRC